MDAAYCVAATHCSEVCGRCPAWVAITRCRGLRGAPLARPPRQERLGIKWSPAQLALRWVLDHPEPAVTLSGMNRMDHVNENIEVACATEPGSMTGHEQAMVDAIRERYREKTLVECTACGYCMPCRQGVNIPRVFSLYNDMSVFDAERARMFYRRVTNPDEWASHCVECGVCEEHCPQGISIMERLAEAHEALLAEDRDG